MAIDADFTLSLGTRIGDGFLSIRLDDASSGSITSRKWIFGDGTEVDGNLTQIKHTYRSPGRYTVSLVARNASEQDTETKEDYFIVNPPPPVISRFVIAQSFDKDSGEYWRFYLDRDRYLIYENRIFIYRSSEPVININKWTFLEFHAETEKMYTAGYDNFREEIAVQKSSNTSPIINIPETLTQVADRCTLKLDELKVYAVERDPKEYYKTYRQRAGDLDYS